MSLRLASRNVLVTRGLALVTLAVPSACISNSGGSNVVPMPSDDGGEGTSRTASAAETWADGGCPEQSNVVLGAHATFPVSWTASLASGAGTGNVNIWMISHATSSGPMDLSFSGTAQSCGTTVPDLDLNTIGQLAVCGLGRPCATKVQIQVLEATFAKIARTFGSFGTQTGWNPGDTLATAASLGLLGLAQSSTYATDTTAWPDNTGCASSCACTGTGTGTNASYSGTCGVFQGSVVTDDDGDGMPGITANPKNDTGSNRTYTYPPTTATVFSTPPLADQVYIVSRNEVQLTGMRMNDCAHGAGTAKITLFDNHVVGCHATATSTNGGDSYTGPPGLCDSTQTAFLDDIRPIYTASNGTAASPSNPIMGTVIVQELAASATCKDVLAF